MRKLYQISILIILAIFYCKVSASEYFCPEIREPVKIGQVFEKNWFIWNENEEMNKKNITYYQENPQSINNTEWRSLIVGDLGKNQISKHLYIACCSWQKTNVRNACAYKFIKEKYCKTFSREKPQMKFICGNEPFDTPYSRIMKKLHG